VDQLSSQLGQHVGLLSGLSTRRPDLLGSAR
jgi:hypothetical protein